LEGEILFGWNTVIVGGGAGWREKFIRKQTNWMVLAPATDKVWVFWQKGWRNLDFAMFFKVK
jgi:hypothetical protein